MHGQPSREQELVICCLRGGDPDLQSGIRLRVLLEAGPDWDKVLSLASGQAVLPLLHRCLSQHHAWIVPETVLAQTEAARRWHSQSNLALTRTLLEVMGAFERAGIAALAFKGPALALQLYDDVGHRSFSDLDILAPPDQIEDARTILIQAGFSPIYAASPKQRQLLHRRGSHEGFQRSDLEVVELHWRVAGPISDFSLDYDRLRARSELLNIGASAVRVFAPADLLIVLCIHGTKHAWERLAWICDVAELIRRYPSLDWDALWMETDRTSCTRVVRLGIRLAAEFLDAPVPREIAADLLADRTLTPVVEYVRRGLFVPPRSGAGTLRFHMGTRPGLKAKVLLPFRALPALNQRDLSVVRLPDAFLPLYYVVRPLRLVGKGLFHLASRALGPLLFRR